MTIALIAAFLAGALVAHGWHKARNLDRDEALRAAREQADFWHEHCDNWHRIAVSLGAGKRNVKRIMVPGPPEKQIVAVGRVGREVWRN